MMQNSTCVTEERRSLCRGHGRRPSSDRSFHRLLPTSVQRLTNFRLQPVGSMAVDLVDELAVPDGFYVLKDDLLDQKDAGTLFVAGNTETADHLVICMPGFPD
eukprot:647384-Pleurochrysis_carterae.AAC.1